MKKIIYLLIFLIKLYLSYQSTSVINIDNGGEREAYLQAGEMQEFSSLITEIQRDMQIRVFPKIGTSGSPQLYVSLTKQPKGVTDSDYYSTTPGENYVVIPNSKLSLNNRIYYAVFCERECFYSVEIKYDDKIEINMNTFNAFTLESNSDLILKFKSDPIGFEVSVYSPENTKFKVFFQKEVIPNSQNTINMFPTFIGGFGAELMPGNKDFCEECYYYMVIVEEDSNDIANNSGIIISLNTVDKYAHVEEFFPIFSVVSENNRRCYKFIAPQNAIADNVITTLAIFSGSVKLDINPGNPSSNAASSKFIYDIPVSRVFRHNKDDFNFLDFRDIYYCITGLKDSSFMLKIIMEKNTEKNQSYNFLVNGVEETGYVPGKMATRFRIVDLKNNKSVNIILKTSEGKPKLLGYICTKISSCYVDYNDYKNNKLKSSLVKPSEYSNDNYLQTVYVEDYSNLCTEKKDQCGLNAVVVCESDEECIFDIVFTFQDTPTILKEK